MNNERFTRHFHVPRVLARNSKKATGTRLRNLACPSRAGPTKATQPKGYAEGELVFVLFFAEPDLPRSFFMRRFLSSEAPPRGKATKHARTHARPQAGLAVNFQRVLQAYTRKVIDIYCPPPAWLAPFVLLFSCTLLNINAAITLSVPTTGAERNKQRKWESGVFPVSFSTLANGGRPDPTSRSWPPASAR